MARPPRFHPWDMVHGQQVRVAFQLSEEALSRLTLMTGETGWCKDATLKALEAGYSKDI